LTSYVNPARGVLTSIYPTPTMAQTTFTISDLAQEFDLTTRAIRFYEDMGLLQPERTGPGGRVRQYSSRDRTRLKLTLRAKRLGLSLTEAKDIIDMYDSPRDTAPQLGEIFTGSGGAQAPAGRADGRFAGQP
jgi:DNA-binding transcriptional MerR regulator